MTTLQALSSAVLTYVEGARVREGERARGDMEREKKEHEEKREG